MSNTIIVHEFGQISMARRVTKRKRYLKFVYSLVLILIILYGMYFIQLKVASKIQAALSPLAGKESFVLSEATNNSTPKTNNTNLKSLINNELANSTGKYGIYIKNLKTSEMFTLNENISFQSASLYKLWVMAAVFEKISNGVLKGSDILSQKVEVLNQKFRIATDSAELTEGVITLSVSNALDRMITISDNYSALLLAERVRLSSVSSFLVRNGFTKSKVGATGESPITTPLDVGLFFEKLYSRQLGDEDSTNKMLDLLKKQKLNKKIPRLLPEALTIAHKTGELGQFTHDAGIIYDKNNDYILVIMTESKDPLQAEDHIASISKIVYDYFDI